MISIRIDATSAQEQLDRILGATRNPRRIYAAGGAAVRNRLVAHYREKQRTGPNKLGGKRTNFWLQVGRSVQIPQIGTDRVTVSINHPAIAQKVYGGDIRAKRVKNLAIPVDPEAYGRAPAVFEKETGLELSFVKANGKAFLSTSDAAGFKVRYLLTPRVKQAPDPTALPRTEDILTAFVTQAQAALDRETRATP
jgi:hypothetical protein